MKAGDVSTFALRGSAVRAADAEWAKRERQIARHASPPTHVWINSEDAKALYHKFSHHRGPRRGCKKCKAWLDAIPVEP